MGRWKYTLKSGKMLRESILQDDSEEVLKNLKKCFEEIHSLIPQMYDEDDLEEDIAEIDSQLDNLENYEEYDMTREDCEDAINYCLDNFYDICDANRIWVDGI